VLLLAPVLLSCRERQRARVLNLRQGLESLRCEPSFCDVLFRVGENHRVGAYLEGANGGPRQKQETTRSSQSDEKEYKRPCVSSGMLSSSFSCRTTITLLLSPRDTQAAFVQISQCCGATFSANTSELLTL
jgi:hypothetical protein